PRPLHSFPTRRSSDLMPAHAAIRMMLKPVRKLQRSARTPGPAAMSSSTAKMATATAIRPVQLRASVASATDASHGLDRSGIMPGGGGGGKSGRRGDWTRAPDQTCLRQRRAIRPRNLGEAGMVKLYDKETGQKLGEITEEQLELLMDE